MLGLAFEKLLLHWPLGKGLGMNSKKLAAAYALSVPDDVSVPRLARLIEKNGCATVDDVKRALNSGAPKPASAHQPDSRSGSNPAA
jgi:hypothetical protein